MGGAIKASLPPWALLHYSQFEKVCSVIGDICQHLDKWAGGWV